MKIADLNRILKDEIAFSVLDEYSNEKSAVDIKSDTEKEIKGIAYDSRNVKDGYVFVAAVGAITDGHNYIPKAVENGASVIICELKDAYEKYKAMYPYVSFIMVKSSRMALAMTSKEFFGNACDKMKIIGITGTKGKTSTSFMIAGILNEAGLDCGIIGTTGTYYAGNYEFIDNSTPESYELHRMFADMLACGVKYCVMEVSSQALMMYRVYGIHFDTGVFTNITPDHIGTGEHKSFDEYLSFKGKLFTMCDKAVINADSDNIDYIEDIIRSNNVSLVRYSCKKEVRADYYGFDESFYIDTDMKTEYTLKTASGENYRLKVGTPGKFTVYNSLCASSVCLGMGVGIDAVKAALQKVKVIGRTEPVHHEKAKNPIIIDYAHNAVSLESLIVAIRAYNPKRIICVFGCGGNRSKLRRYEMGEVSGKLADLSVITSDNPRDEELDDIIDDILVGMKKTDGEYVIIKSRREAIFYALSHAMEGDIVILAGKGQQDYEEVKGVKYHLDEREVVKEYFDSL